MLFLARSARRHLSIDQSLDCFVLHLSVSKPQNRRGVFSLCLAEDIGMSVYNSLCLLFRFPYVLVFSSFYS